MTTATTIMHEVEGLLDESRISRERREAIDNRIRRLVGNGRRPVGVDTVPAADAPAPDTYAGRYYWQNRDQAAARFEQPADVKVRPIHLDAMSEFDQRERRSPGGWRELVEVDVTVRLDDSGRTTHLVGDLSPRAARLLAADLLAAAEAVTR